MSQSYKIEKVSQDTGATSPIYITTGPVKGKIFTAADLVVGKGYLEDGGNKFVPKTWKAHSLAEKIQSKDFGKIDK